MAQQNWWESAPVVDAPRGGPLPSPPKIEDPAKVAADARDERRLQLAEDAAKRAEDAANRASQSPVSEATAKRTEANVGTYTSLSSAGSTFKDDYGGNLIGGLENLAQSFVDVGTPGQREWWAAFKATDNQIRNDLFGAALTATEKAAYEATTVSPGMRPEIIRKNVARRTEIIKAALERQRAFMLANGSKPDAVDALFKPITQQPATEAPADAPPPINGPGMNAAGQIAGNTHNNGEDGALKVAGTSGEQYRREDDPTLAGAKGEYLNRLARGESADQLIAWLNTLGMKPSPERDGSVRAQVDFRRKNPAVAMGEYDISQFDDRYVPLTEVERNAGQAADSAIGAGVISAGDAFTGFNLDSIVGATGGNAERARVGMDEIRDRHPVASTVGTLAGGTAGALAIEGGLAARGAAGMGRALAADGIYGGVAGAGATDYAGDGSPATIADRAIGGVKGVGAGIAGSYLGSKATGLTRGVKDPSVSAVQEAGVRLTPGQQYQNSGRIGAAIKGIEDRIEGLPIIGDPISGARRESVVQWNAKTFDEALKPIGGSVMGKTGEEAVGLAQGQVSKAFDDALQGKVVQADEAFANDLAGAVQKVRGIRRIGPEVADDLADVFRPYADLAEIDGPTMQVISRELQAIKRSYASDVRSNAINKAIDAVDDSVAGMFQRQTPEVMPAYTKAKAAFRRLSIVEDAVLKGNNTEGIFTAAQLGMANRANAVKFDGKHSAARGDSPLHDWQRAGQDVLPNQVPDSGTAGRLLIPGVLLGGGSAIDSVTDGGGTALTIGAILSGAYSKGGLRALSKPGRGMKASRARDLIENEKARRAIGAGTGATAASLTNQQ